jgi:processive 1,2-diacylglycerol beta-glucosyltransferase
MIELRDKDTGVALGTISEEQLDFLAKLLVEESSEDHDYYINQDTLELLEKNGADPELLDLIRGALGTRDDMEIEWSRS